MVTGSTPCDLFDLSGRVAIVTGASSGLGERFATVLAAAGAAVVATARRGDRLAALATEHPEIVSVPGDMTDPAHRSRLVDGAVQRFGRIDVLIGNAGVCGPPTAAVDYPGDRWDRTIDLNLTALFALTQLVAPSMIAAASGSIVNVASILGLVAGAPLHEAAYSASKGAVVNLTRSLAAEWAGCGVRVNAIAPGWIDTEMTRDMDDDRSQTYIRRGCPIGRMGRPDELDGALLFLASDASSYCTGQTIAIDGGWTAR